MSQPNFMWRLVKLNQCKCLKLISPLYIALIQLLFEYMEAHFDSKGIPYPLQAIAGM